MAVFDIIATVATLLLGVVIGALVVGLAGLLGIAGWIAGLIFALLVLAITIVHDKMMGFEMKHAVRLIARLSNQEAKEIEATRHAQDKENRRDYYGFFIGTVLGIGISLFWTPDLVFDLLPF